MVARHRAFIAPRLMGGLVALAALPVFLAVRGVPGPLEFIVLVWMVAPIAAACYLSRTGCYESAHILSALSLAGVATAVAAFSDGVDSIAAIWLVLIPLEATASASRRVVTVAALLSLGAAGLLMLAFPATGVSPTAAVAGLGIVSALLYAIAIALGADWVARVDSRPLLAQDERGGLFATNPTDVVTRHGDGGRVVFASANAQDVLGIAAGELRGFGLLDRIHIGDRPAFLAALSDASTRGSARSVEFRIRQPKLGDAEGRFVWIEMQCKPLDQSQRSNGGTAGREVVAIMRDVSKQKAEQQALIDARAEADRCSAANSRVLAIMSHELRAPLDAIIGFSEMLANAEQLHIEAERRQDYVRLINESGAHMIEMMNDILDASRLETGDFKILPEPFKPAAVIEGCRERLAHKARDLGITLQFRVLEELPDVVSDKHAMSRIVTNLVAHALKSTSRGGTVTVEAGVDREHLVVSVEDSGIGAASGHAGRLGDAFFRVRGCFERSHHGASLGLSVVKGLVSLHGGEVVTRSRVGEGTRVMVRLPLDCERRPQLEPLRKAVRSGVDEYPHMPPFTTAAAPRFKTALKRSA